MALEAIFQFSKMMPILTLNGYNSALKSPTEKLRTILESSGKWLSEKKKSFPNWRFGLVENSTFSTCLDCQKVCFHIKFIFWYILTNTLRKLCSKNLIDVATYIWEITKNRPKKLNFWLFFITMLTKEDLGWSGYM